MSDEEENGDEYKIRKQQSDINDSQCLEIEAPTREEAQQMFDENWDKEAFE